MTHCPTYTDCTECEDESNVECQNYDWSDVSDHTSVATRFGDEQDLNELLEELKKNGFIVIGLSGDGQLSISSFHEKSPLVVIVGAEDRGISLLTQKKCDFLLSIPLKGKTSSLNASVAAAVSLFHLTS